jgi:hypothetical protein
MARPDPSAAPCTHLLHAEPDSTPFTLVRILDEVGGVADAIVRCRTCEQAYLIELLDWSGPSKTIRQFRVSLVDEALLARFLKNLDRGSCDIKRAPAEKQSFESQTRLAPVTVTLRAEDLAVVAVEGVAFTADVPMGSWRERLR